jgi:aspartyl/asparaginyl beta-hydroxylase (cupin superfamily)
MKNAEEIKLLMGKFNDAHINSDHAEYMSMRKDLSKEEKEEWEDEAHYAESELHTIAEKIKALNPSQYMMEKYTELDYILTFA